MTSKTLPRVAMKTALCAGLLLFAQPAHAYYGYGYSPFYFGSSSYWPLRALFNPGRIFGYGYGSALASPYGVAYLANSVVGSARYLSWNKRPQMDAQAYQTDEPMLAPRNRTRPVRPSDVAADQIAYARWTQPYVVPTLGAQAPAAASGTFGATPSPVFGHPAGAADGASAASVQWPGQPAASGTVSTAPRPASGDPAAFGPGFAVGAAAGSSPGALNGSQAVGGSPGVPFGQGYGVSAGTNPGNAGPGQSPLAAGFVQLVNSKFDGDIQEALFDPEARSWAKAIGLVSGDDIFTANLSDDRIELIERILKEPSVDPAAKIQAVRALLRI